MVEESFLLFKPEAFMNPSIFVTAEQMLLGRKISINSKSRVQLSRDQVLGIWKKRCFDPFSYYLMIEAYENKEFEIWMLEGEAAIGISKEIKKALRKLYAYSFACNGVHSPSSRDEYEDNMLSIKRETPFVFPSLFFSLSDLIANSKRKISEDDLKACALDFIPQKEEQIIELGNLPGKFRVVVEIDNVHWLTEYAVALFNCFEEMPLLDAYMYATNIVENDESVVFASEDLLKASESKDFLRQLGLSARITEGNQSAVSERNKLK